jgi:hypothetical protein
MIKSPSFSLWASSTTTTILPFFKSAMADSVESTGFRIARGLNLNGKALISRTKTPLTGPDGELKEVRHQMITPGVKYYFEFLKIMIVTG